MIIPTRASMIDLSALLTMEGWLSAPGGGAATADQAWVPDLTVQSECHYERMTEPNVYLFDGSWPASTITGEPSVVDGELEVSIDQEGGAILTGSYGPSGAPPEECEHFQYSLAPEQARRLGEVLLRSL